MALVTLAQLQAHLRLPVGVSSPPTTAEDDLQLKLDAAAEAVLQYIARPSDAAWTLTIAGWDGGSPVVPVPTLIQLAILEMAAALSGFRGDDLESPKADHGDLPPVVKTLLYRYRDPALA